MMDFISLNQEVDRESLRLYAREKLEKLRLTFFNFVYDQELHNFWINLQSYIATKVNKKDRQKYFEVVSQVKHLPEYINGWENMAIESSERLEFFVLSKAAELRSGNQEHDYFWALQIRHDQIVGLIKVLSALETHINEWRNLSAKEVVEHPVFLGLLDCSIDTQVYLEAENVYKERNKWLNN